MKRGVLLVVCAGLCLGCKTATDFDYPDDLSSPNYVKRTHAAREFARRRDEANADKAFPLLTDEQPVVRALVHETLREMSGGEDFGYRADLDEVDRWRVARRWQFWWESRHG